ncbi:MAG: restriction endonuclease [Candidatus Aenigmatarchaeota archaeon]
MKFCPYCGTNLQFIGKVSQATTFQQHIQPSIAPSQPTQQPIEEDLEPVKLNIYDLGLQLENTTALIFEKMGYKVEKRKRVPTKSGATAEIDILLTRGIRKRAVECKNYDPSRTVGIQDMRVFKDKLSDIGIASGIFVTNTYFSEDAQKLAESIGIELWDGDKLREKFYAYAIGRIKNPSLVHDPVLPLKVDFTSASSLSLRNNQSIRLFSAVLLYHPYFLIKYRLQSTRKDPTGKTHTITDNSTYFVDALDGDIINRERGFLETVTGILSNKKERIESREDKMVSEDLKSISPVMEPVLSSIDYQVSVADQEITEEDAVKIVKSYVVEKNKRDISYNIKIRGEIVNRSFKLVPHLNEVIILGTKLVYVPKWDLEYEAGQTSFTRRFLASSGRTLEDELAKCQKCTLLKRETVAVCEVCGQALCDKHITLAPDGKYYCDRDLPPQFKTQDSNIGSIFKKIIKN